MQLSVGLKPRAPGMNSKAFSFNKVSLVFTFELSVCLELLFELIPIIRTNLLVKADILRNKTMGDKFIYFLHDEKQYHSYCGIKYRLNSLVTDIFELTKQNPITFSSQRIK